MHASRQNEMKFGKSQMGVSKNRGVYPPKWMVFLWKTLLKWDDLGVPLFLETPK